MGKNINQIATFYDLFEIGYRIGDDAKQGVTYSDLLNAKYVSETDLNKMVGFDNVEGPTDKCVKWSNVPGTDGQNPDEYGPEEGVRCPVKCTITNQLGLNNPTRATRIIFYYNYKKYDGTNGHEDVGSITLGQNNQITSTSSGICKVLVNPKLSDDKKEANWLSVWCGTSNGSVLFNASSSMLKNPNTYSSAANSKRGTSCEIWTDVRDTREYYSQLRNLAGIKFTISP